MNREEAILVLDSVHAAANAITKAARQGLTERQVDALSDRVFFGLLLALVEDMTLAQFFDLVDSGNQASR
jgi:hypothetical protein